MHYMPIIAQNMTILDFILESNLSFFYVNRYDMNKKMVNYLGLIKENSAVNRLLFGHKHVTSSI